MKAAIVFSVLISSIAFSTSCTKRMDRTNQLQGSIKIDGSSTVFPVSEAMAEEFGFENPRVRVTVGLSGTGGGFKKFIRNEIDISDASRPIKDEEAKDAKHNNVKYLEIPIAYDGLAIVVNPKNDFVKQLSIEQLRSIWMKDSKIRNWKDLNASWPNEPIKLYGPGPDSGTFDYFVEEVLGKDGKPRPDFVASEDDNVLVRGVTGDQYALGYFGYAYVIENQDKVRLIPVSRGGGGAITANDKTVKDSTYPLSRPIFIYVNHESSRKKEVHAFVKFYLKNAPKIVPQTGYIPLPNSIYEENIKKFEEWSARTEITQN